MRLTGRGDHRGRARRRLGGAGGPRRAAPPDPRLRIDDGSPGDGLRHRRRRATVGGAELRLTGRVDLTRPAAGRGVRPRRRRARAARWAARGAPRASASSPEREGTRLAWDLEAETEGALARLPDFVVRIAAGKLAEGFVAPVQGGGRGGGAAAAEARASCGGWSARRRSAPSGRRRSAGRRRSRRPPRPTAPRRSGPPPPRPCRSGRRGGPRPKPRMTSSGSPPGPAICAAPYSSSGVRIEPGEIDTTRTPCGAQSTAIARVMAWTAPLVVA